MPALLKIDPYRDLRARPAPLGRLTLVSDRPDAEVLETEAPTVLVVDDDDEVREAVCGLLESVGVAAAGFGSARELFESPLLRGPGCLILDVRMPGLGGLALQDQLIARRITRPVIFLTGHGDIPMSVQAMKAGAVDFLAKPVRDQTLLDAVNAALDADVQARADTLATQRNIDLFATLTPRERQVMHAVVQGGLNKCIAYDLGISEVTVKLHRSSAMRKMGATSIIHLVSAWQSLPADVREARHAELA